MENTPRSVDQYTDCYTNYATEWCVLQNQYDSYEKHSLYIKLISVVVLLSSTLSQVSDWAIVLLLLVLWLQDSIWKTFQSRIEPRLLSIEHSIAEKRDEPAFQFNRDYQNTRGGSLGLIVEYLRQSVRPTVAFPHVILIAIALLFF